jgi:hypothetical protein
MEKTEPMKECTAMKTKRRLDSTGMFNTTFERLACHFDSREEAIEKIERLVLSLLEQLSQAPSKRAISTNGHGEGSSLDSDRKRPPNRIELRLANRMKTAKDG